jgi:hypothetical protein
MNIFLRTAASVQSKDNLIAEYEQTQKAPNESFLLYLNKVENLLEKLQFNNIPIGDLKTQSYKFLRGLQMNNIYGDILMNFESKQEWYMNNMSLRQIALKAQIYFEEYTAIHGIHKEANPPPPKPKPSPKPTPKPSPKPTPKPSPTTPTVPQRTAVESEVTRITNILKQASNKTAAIYGITRDHEYNCPIHPNGNHNILNCYKFGNICEGEKAFREFNNVRTDLGLTPMTDRANRKYPPRFQTDINNNRFPTSRAHEQVRRAQSSDNPYAVLDNADDESKDDTSEQSSHNNINKQSQSYFSLIPNNNNSNLPPFPRICCRYTQSTTSNNIPLLEQKGLYKAVIDSGATHHMTNIKSAFESITPFNKNQPFPQALMGDDSTSLNIEGYGWMNITIHGKHIRVLGYYVPKLGVTLLSVKQHMKFQGCYFHAESNNALLAFPSFVLHPSTNDEIEVLFKSNNDPNSTLDFNQQCAIECKQHKHNVDKCTHDINVFPSTMKPFLQPDQQIQFKQTIQIQKLIPSARIPTQGTKRSIGYDVSSVMNTVIAPGEIQKIPTGLSAALPDGMYLRIAPCSSLTSKNSTIHI